MKLELDVHVYLHNMGGVQDSAMLNRLDKISALIITQGAKVMKELDDLTAAVEAETTVGDSMATLLTELSGKIAEAAGEPEKLKALAETITAKTTEWAAAVVANTPHAAPAADTETP